MSNDSAYEIKAEEGDTLKALGYIRSDFIYGAAHKSDILSEADGSSVYAMYKVGIIDTDYNQIKDYEEPGIYVSGAEVEGMRITLSRVVMSDGGYVSTSIDQLINKDENVTDDGIQTEAISTDYVYGYGTFQGSRANLTPAIVLANETYGTVIGSKAGVVWKRYRNSQASVDGVTPVITGNSLISSVQMLCNYLGGGVNAADYMNQGHNAVETLNQINGVKGISVTGVSYDEMLSCISDGRPVIAKISSDEYIVITAYNSNQIAYIESSTGTQKTISMSDAGKMFSQGGNIFVTYYK